jgi:hypothetical protein
VSTERLQVVPPDRRKHQEPVVDLVAKVFSDIGYYRARDCCRDLYVGNSHYDWSAARIGFLGEQLVTHFGVWDYQMRIGAARVRVGGIGAVATHGDFRRRGLMDETARASLAAMREASYDMTILFGIDNFYHRFGYVRAWADGAFLIRAVDLPKEAPSSRLRSFRSIPRADLAELYNDFAATTTGTAVRPTYRRGFPWTEGLQGLAWGNGAVEGYIVFSHEGPRLKCVEACGDVNETLRALGVAARKGHSDEVQFETLPAGSEMAKCLRRGNCRTELRYRRNGGPMICLLNLRSSLEKMAGELTARLQASPYVDWRGELLLDNGAEQVGLATRRGEVRVTTPRETPHFARGGAEMAQLLLGTEGASEVAEAGRFELGGVAATLLPILFPAQYPQLSQLDRY